MIEVMKAVQPRLTCPKLRLMSDDGKQYELIDGKVSAAPRHQRALANLLVSIHNHIRAGSLGGVYLAPFDVVFGEEAALQHPRHFKTGQKN
jgi:hypothetical protein